jgi:hypothetical protein
MRLQSSRMLLLQEDDPLECAIVGGLAPITKTNECGLPACFSVMAHPRFLGCNELAIGGLQNKQKRGAIL